MHVSLISKNVKNFDTIDHNKLLFKLPKYGIHDLELQWIKSYLHVSQRKQTVKFGNKVSSELKVEVDVLHGSVLGPGLFLICINGLNGHL